MIDSDYRLEREAAQLALDAFTEAKESAGKYFDPESAQDDIKETLWQWCDGHSAVIYTHKAGILCANCRTTDGEDWLEGIYGKPFDGCDSWSDVVSRLAFACLYVECEKALETLIDEYEPPIDQDEEEE